jgi:membrane-associated phospholipid phosphatase
MLGTMADAFANSIMVDALILGREGTTVPEISCYAPVLPGIEVATQMDRWEPWVRAYAAVGEMLQGIILQKAASGNAFQVLSSTSLIAEIGRPQQATFEKQIPLVLSWAELRNERATEIMAQIDPQYAFWSSIIYMHPDRTKRTFELINILLQFCVYVEMRFKHALACWRPVEYNAQVQPILTTPGHGSFPSGHSTQAHAVAYVLRKLLNLDPNPQAPKYPTVIEQLKRQAARIATNRVVAGVHFPVDSMAGRMLGVALGEYFVGRCTATVAAPRKFTSRTFNAGIIDSAATTEFNPFNTDQKLDEPPSAGKVYSAVQGPNDIPPSPLMQQVWDKAHDEWAGKFL